MKNLKDGKWTLYVSQNHAQVALNRRKPLTGYVDQCEQEAKLAIHRKHESFERCDTDGFLSQFCHGLTAQRERLKHEIAMHGNTDVFPVIVDIKTGKIVSTRLFRFNDKFSYGTVDKWCVKRGETVDWVTHYRRESSFTKKGLALMYIVAPAYVASRSPWDKTPEQYGTGGLCNVSYYTYIQVEAGFSI